MNTGDLKVSLRSAGFTILETMIVLAVTAALFVAIAATLSGRQNEAEFIHAIQDAKSQMQQVINQVAEGVYPSSLTNGLQFSCSSPGSSGRLNFYAGHSQQGTNSGCVFLGKVIQFDVQNSSSNESAYNIYTVAGLQNFQSPSNSPRALFINDLPTVTTLGNNGNGPIEAYTTSYLEYGLSVCWISVGANNYNSCSNNGIGAIGFLMQPGNENFLSPSGYDNGTQPVDLIPILQTALNQSPRSTVQAIDTSLEPPYYPSLLPSNINPSGGVKICLSSASTNQSGLITIGGSSNPLLVSLQIFATPECQ